MIKTLTIEDYSRWDHFVNENNDATFFHQAGWQDVISKAFGHQTYYIYVENMGSYTTAAASTFNGMDPPVNKYIHF